jgi:hypothetical protein
MMTVGWGSYEQQQTVLSSINPQYGYGIGGTSLSVNFDTSVTLLQDAIGSITSPVIVCVFGQPENDEDITGMFVHYYCENITYYEMILVYVCMLYGQINSVFQFHIISSFGSSNLM